MFEKMIGTWIALAGFCISVVTIIIRLSTRIVTLENKAAEMDKDLCKIMQSQQTELEQTRRDLTEHEKSIAVLTSQMADVKNIVTSINTKIDRLLTAS